MYKQGIFTIEENRPLTASVYRHLGAEGGCQIDALPTLGAGVQRVAGVDFGGGENRAALSVGEIGEGGDKQLLGSFGNHRRLARGCYLIEAICHASLVGGQGRRAVHNRRGGDGIGEGGIY